MTWIPSYKKDAIYIPNWSAGSDESIVRALQAHYAGDIDLTKYWSVGDERTVSLSAMSATGVGESHVAQEVVLVLSNVGGKYLADGVTECLFQVDQKDCLKELGYMNSSDTNTGGWRDCARRTWCNSTYYNAIPSPLRSIFKQFINQSGKGGGSTSGVVNTTDYFALRSEIEVLGSIYYSVSGEGSQVKWYETSSNIDKMWYPPAYKEWRVGANWLLRSPYSGGSDNFCSIKNGDKYSRYANATACISPFGVI